MAVFVAKLTQMINHVETRAREATQPLDGLRRAIGAQLEFHDQHRAFFVIFSRERPSAPNGKSEEWNRVRECFDRHTEVLRVLIEDCQRRKLLRKADSQCLALMLLGMLLQMTRDFLERASAAPIASQAEFVADLFLHGAATERRAA
jgi:hypothetical protein